MNNVSEMQKSPLFTDLGKTTIKKVDTKSYRDKVGMNDTIRRQDANVSISDLVKEFAKIKMAVDQAEDIDNSDKVDQIRRELDSNSYRIDYDKLAEHIMLDEL